MKLILRVLMAAVALPALARPVLLESTSTIAAPDRAYVFDGPLAIDGDYALVGGSRTIPSPDANPELAENWRTFWLLHRAGTSWTVVRKLAEYRDDPVYLVQSAVAMQNGIAAVQTGGHLDFYELRSGGWALAPSDAVQDAPGRSLRIDGARVISGEGYCSRDGRVFAKDTGGVWHTSALLKGADRSDGCDDEFRGSQVDVGGAWAAVNQPDPESGSPQVLVFHDYGGTEGWNLLPYGSADPPEGATTFGSDVAIHGANVLVAGGLDSGTYVYREVTAQGFQLAERVQTVDGFTGGNRAKAFGRGGEFLLQSAYSADRAVDVVQVFRRNAANGYEHVAILAGRNGETLRGTIAISGRRILATSSSGLVNYFELPASLVAPAPLQDTFSGGNGDRWTQTSGSAFAAATPAGASRVLRQSATTVEARAILAASDFTNEAIEADIRVARITAGGGVGLATRYQGPQNFFDVVLRAGRVELRRMASGSLRVLASTAFSPSTARAYRVRLESIGTLHRVSIDGQVMLDFDVGGPSHGRAVLYTDRAAADFDNVLVTPSLTATIYAADFDDGNVGPWTRTGLGYWNLWTGTSTVWNQSSVLGDSRASIGAPADDQIVRVRARLDTFANASGAQERWFGVMARYTDDRNFYYLSLRSSGTVSLRKFVDGAVTTLATRAFAVTPATWYALRIEAVGDQIRGYVDDRLVLEVTDSSLASGAGGLVMFKAAVDYDDYQAIQP